MSNAKYIIFILYKTCSSRAYTKLITVQPLYLAGKGAGGGGGGEDSCYIQPGFQESGTGTNLVQCQWVEVHSGGGLWGLGQSTSWLKTHSTFCLVCVVVSVVQAIALGGGKVRGGGREGEGGYTVQCCTCSVALRNFCCCLECSFPSGHKVCKSSGSDPATLFWGGRESICRHQFLHHLVYMKLESETQNFVRAAPGELGGKTLKRPPSCLLFSVMGRIYRIYRRKYGNYQHKKTLRQSFTKWLRDKRGRCQKNFFSKWNKPY